MEKLVAVVALALCIGPASTALATTVLITGSSRGIGYAFAEKYAQAGYTVIATARDPEDAKQLNDLAARHANVRLERLDVTKDDDIRALAAKYKGQAVDVLINNAGVAGSREAQTLGSFSRRDFHEIVDVNTFGALAVSQAFVDNVAASTQKKIIAVTSSFGSISAVAALKSAGSETGTMGPYYYRMSKAALNMGMRTLAEDVRNRGITVALVAPGAVDTDMLRGVVKEWAIDIDVSRAMQPRESVAQLIVVIDQLTPERAARGISNHDGTIIPW